MKTNLFGLYINEIQALLAELSIPSYRAKQIAEWIYQRGVNEFSAMQNLPLAMRVLLEERFVISSVAVLRQLNSADGKTTKFLLGFSDGVAIETVLMRQHYGNSVCVSTQAGCNIGCIFCASALNGMVRNLTAGEILAQVLLIDQLLKKEQQKVNTIVIMGSGEPLANYDNVLSFIRLCHEEYILNLGYRNITVSTSGIVPMIEKLAEEAIPLNLSISLHAPNDLIRSELMPINKKYDVGHVVAAGAAYGQKTGRRVTYEYILIADKNDSVQCAKELARLLRGQLANVNLIPINPVLERGLTRPSPAVIAAFEETLDKNHITVTIRREMGNDIQAACGQLRNQHQNSTNEGSTD